MNSKQSRIIQFIILTFSILIFASAIFSYKYNISKIEKLTSEHTLEESTGLYTSYLQLKFTEDFNYLSAVATAFSFIDTENDELIKEYIQKFSRKTDFSDLYIIDNHGHGFTSSGEFIEVNTETDYFRRAYEKQIRTISKKLILDHKGTPSFVLAYPIIKDGQSVGVICGLMNPSRLNTNLFITSIKTEGYFMIMDEDGEIVFASENKNRLCYEKNFINFLRDNASTSQKDLVNFISRIRYKEKGVISFKVGQKKRFCSYSFLGLNRWYLLCFQPTDFLDNQHTNTKRITISVLIIILLLIAVFIGLIFNANKRTQIISDSKESLSKIYEKNKSLVLDIDHTAGIISYSGDTVFVFGKQIEQTGFHELEKYSSKIHKEDFHVIKELRKAAFETFTEYTAEFRICCDDENFYWFRLNNLPIFDENHKPVRCILSLTNVNKQVLKEQELILRAEVDSLSGLLNKGSFENKVQQFIAKSKNQYCALLIIDLDNFKKINDTLGHSMGDIAISDVAKKISLIFTIKDFLGRIGGDEFCAFVIFEKDMPLSECIMRLNEKTGDLCEIINEMYFNDDKYVEISASIGISIFPEQGATYQELFSKADNALYNVKKNGKNGFIIWNSDLLAGTESSYSGQAAEV